MPFSGSDTPLETRFYADAPDFSQVPAIPSYAEAFAEIGGGGGTLRTASYFDGLGNVLREVRDGPNVGGWIGVGSQFDFAGRPIRATVPQSCGDAHCKNLTGAEAGIQTTYDAYLSLQLLENQVCFLGHSHVPITFFQGEMISYTLHPEITLEEGHRALVNIGSIGQPRDDNPRASFAIYDTEARKIRIMRVEYDVETAAAKIRKAGLPEPLAERLKYGR